MAHLVVVVGLPASGKSTYIKKREGEFARAGSPVALVAHDYMKNSLDGTGDLTASRNLEPLRAALAQGRPCIIGDIAFTEAGKRADLMRTLSDLPMLLVEWVFFENSPERCLRNVEWDAVHKGRNRTHRSREIRERTHSYVVPPGFTPIPVHLAEEAGSAAGEDE
jgi:predicted kinase